MGKKVTSGKSTSNDRLVNETKNRLRPFFRKQTSTVFWKQIGSIRSSLSTSNARTILDLVEDKNYYPFQGLGSTFPREGNRVIDPRYRNLNSLGLKSEVVISVMRMNFHKKRLIQALESLAEVNRSINEFDFDRAAHDAQRFRSDYGLSLIGLKKELYVSSCQGSLPSLLRCFKNLTSGSENSAWALMARVGYDIADPTNDAVRASRVWLSVVQNRTEKQEWYSRVIEQDILGYTFTTSSIGTGILRFSACSLIDLSLYVWRQFFIESDLRHRELFMSLLDPDIFTTLSRFFVSSKLSVGNTFVRNKEGIEDSETYRISYFFNDIAEISHWRGSLNRMLFYKDDGHVTGVANDLFARVSEVIKRPSYIDDAVSSLVCWQDAPFNESLVVSRRDLMRTALGVSAVRRTKPELITSNEDFCELLSSIKDAHNFLNRSDLLAFSNLQSRGAQVLTFVAKELLFRKFRSLDDDLERRPIFMQLFPSNDREDIIPFLTRLHDESPLTAMFVARVCTRTFLEKLFLLMTSLKDVLEIRIAICDWMDVRLSDNDNLLKEERDTLDRELRNLDARSDLDSTRVHVDEEGLHEWFIETQSGITQRFIQTVLAEGAHQTQKSMVSVILSNHQKSASDDEDFSAETSVGSDVLLVSIFEETLKAFATDRSFGLDAYLSRRIRHGTLSGQIMTPVAKSLRRMPDIISLYRAAHSDLDQSTTQVVVDNLIRALGLRLDKVRREIIQLKSDNHPQGLIRATWRTVSNSAHLDATIARIRQRVLEQKGYYDIFDEIYALCWSCLEVDLAQLRFHMSRTFLPAALHDMALTFNSFSEDEQDQARYVFMETQLILEARVHEVCGWFIRPVFRRDSYDLRVLISSTCSIIHELDDSFQFKENVIMTEDISLSRASFDIIGDALFVLIGNAAKHGIDDGHVEIIADINKEFEVASISIKSFVRTEEELTNASQRISTALRNISAYDRAAVEEGFSGLRKLAGMMIKIRTDQANLQFSSDHTDLSIRFDLNIPQSLAVYRITA